MKCLIVYYSKTRVTAGVAKGIRQELNCDIEEIIDLKNRSGSIGYIKSCYEAIRGIPSEIKPIDKDPSEYDLVIVGTPIWASTMGGGVLTYLKENKSKFKNLAFFCTCGGSGYNKTLSKMEKIAGKKPLETMFMTKTDIDSSFDVKIQSYVENIKNSLDS